MHFDTPMVTGRSSGMDVTRNSKTARIGAKPLLLCFSLRVVVVSNTSGVDIAGAS